MNNVVLIGRLSRDVNFTPAADGKQAVARYTLAVDRRGKDAKADFISIVAFDKNAEFAHNYLAKGMKIAVQGSITTGSYSKNDGTKVYTTDVVAREQEFCESKATNEAARSNGATQQASDSGNFMDIPDGLDEELPFH